MSHPPRDLTPLPDPLHDAALACPVRTRRPVYGDLLPPCDAGCLAGENIQAWLASTGEHKRAWRRLTADNPCRPSTAGSAITRGRRLQPGRARQLGLDPPGGGSPAACRPSARSPNCGPPLDFRPGERARRGTSTTEGDGSCLPKPCCPTATARQRPRCWARRSAPTCGASPPRTRMPRCLWMSPRAAGGPTPRSRRRPTRSPAA